MTPSHPRPESELLLALAKYLETDRPQIQRKIFAGHLKGLIAVYEGKPALAVGQRWRLRDGEVVTITEYDHDPNTDYPFCAEGHWYDANGNSILKKPDYELIELLTPEPLTPTLRKFASISRKVTDFGYIIDAIDDDGVAWWMIITLDNSEPEWHQLTPLPGRGVVTNG